MFQDLPFKAKYLVTFTVGFDQKDIIKAAMAKVCSPSGQWWHHCHFILMKRSAECLTKCIILLYQSSLQIGRLCFSTMMDGQMNGMSLSGLEGQSISVRGNKVNGEFLIYFDLVFFIYFNIWRGLFGTFSMVCQRRVISDQNLYHIHN